MRLRHLFFILILLPACTPPQALVAPRDFSAELAALQQQQEETDRRLNELRETLRQLEDRLQTQQAAIDDLGRGGAAQKVTPPGENAVPVRPVAPAPPAADTVRTATDIYLKAFSDYASGRFTTAAEGFRSFLQRYPSNDFSGNAQFWLGECYYSQGLLPRANEEFSRVVELYPDNAKAPDALLRMAAVFTELRQPGEAQRTIDLLLNRYPQSSAARKAREQQP